MTAVPGNVDALSRVRLRPRAFRPAAFGGPAAEGAGPGILLSYRGTTRAHTRVTIERKRGAGRWTAVGRFVHADKPGLVRFRLTGRLGGRKLKPGVYRLRLLPRNRTGAGREVVVRFRVL